MSKKVKVVPSIEIINGELIIRISANALKIVAEGKPDADYQILDADGFLKDFAFCLENFAHSNAVETGINELQYLFDEVIDETYTDGSKHIIDNNED